MSQEMRSPKHQPNTEMEAKFSFWEKKINQWKHSGFSQAEFCREQDLNHRAFVYWRNKLSTINNLQRNLQPPSQNRSSFWKEQISQWKNSGFSQSKFCREQGLSLRAFEYWKKKLSKNSMKSPHPSSSEKDFNLSSPQNKIQASPQPSLLLPVSITSTQEEFFELPLSKSSGIALEVKNKIKIQLDTQFHSETLSRLLNLLGEK